MNTIRLLAPAVALAAALALSGCDDRTETIPSGMSETAAKAQAKAGEKLATENITISHTGQPKAQITPQGDLLIDGKAVDVTPEQRKLLLDYRGHIVEIAKAGIAMGVQGAELAGKAVGEALKGVFSGDTDQIEKKVKAEAGKIEDSAKQLCARLPGLFESQQKLAASLPAFAPYARMTREDVTDCRYNQGGSGFQFDQTNDGDDADTAGDDASAKAAEDASADDSAGNAAEEADSAATSGR